ncbi:HlyC/CorC family transporter [Thermosulfurimonas marina]|uniref:HlyC/CorC family transporter n=1 Tax=Thermosulfurimonas marina TaxID=2047767 RepID=A0A6H1WTV1_9BACT|nr:hemolysin family protein [Thermosulfurimonas marina]QJA06601.1 HlyC/CorC family transporter [Thermosulfurimonas marina]
MKGLTLLVFLGLLAGEAFFAAAEIALLSAGKAGLRSLARRHLGARVGLLLLEDPEKLLTTTLLGLNLCVIANGVFTTSLLLEIFPEHGGLLALVGLPPTMLLFGQIIPKNLARARALTLAPLLAPPLYIFSRILYPLVLPISALARRTVEGLGSPKHTVPTYVREELKGLLATEKSLEPLERKALERLFSFAEKTVDQVMVPLVRVKMLPEEARVEEALRIFAHYGFSRIPIFRGRVYRIVGVVYAQDLLDAPAEGRLSAYVRPVRYLPEFKPAAEALSEMQKSGEDYAVVVDEYGAAIGILTLEDLMEEILGDFLDELEQEVKPYLKLGEGHFLLKAFTEVETAREVGLEIPEGEYETVGGFVLKLAGRIPRPGEVFHFGDWEIRVRRATPTALEELEFIKKKSGGEGV